MAATKYQILYRYINPNSKTLITNSTPEEYVESFELYHDKHLIEIGTSEEKIKYAQIRDNLLIEGNNTSNPKYDMLFKYSGTKRKLKRIWVPEVEGYVVRDRAQVERKISPYGNYSGDFVYVGGYNEQSAKVVMHPRVIESLFKNGDAFCNSPATPSNSTGLHNLTNGMRYKSTDKFVEIPVNYYNAEDIKKMLEKFTFLKVKEDQLATPSSFLFPQDPAETSYKVYDYAAVKIDTKLYTNTILVAPYDTIATKSEPYTSDIYALWNANYIKSPEYAYIGFKDKAIAKTCCSSKLILNYDQLEKEIIPGHYEDVVKIPYVMCDCYERIMANKTPWFSFCTCGSLEEALIKVKPLVESVGLDNVQLIKLVPTEQFVKIK